MKSVAQALFWEFFWHNHWLPWFLLAVGNALPLFVLTAMSGLQIDLNSRELAMLQALIPFCAVMIALGVSLGQGPISRLYQKPVSTAKLVAYFFAIGAIPIGLGIAASIALWNHFFELRWPIIGPTIMGVTFWVATWPSMRVQMRSPQRVIEIFLIVIGMASLLVWWWRSKLQGEHNSSHLDWGSFTLLEYATLLGIVSASYWISVRRASLDRCGKNNSWVLDAAIRFLQAWDERGSARSGKFANRYKANFWYEQNTRGIPYVAGIAWLIALVVLLAFGAMLTQSRADLNIENWGASLAMIFLLHILFAGLSGLLIPLLRMDAVIDAKDFDLSELSRERVGAMSDFRSTLPITDAELAKSAMRSIQWSLLWAHAAFTILGLAYWVLIRFFNTSLTDEQIAKLPWIIAFGVLGSWSAMANASALAYWGRWWTTTGIAAALTGIAFTEPVSATLAGVALLILATLALAGVFLIAHRRAILSNQEATTSLAVAAVISLFFVATRPQELPPTTLLYTTVLAILVVVPIAGLPLAIRESRRR